MPSLDNRLILSDRLSSDTANPFSCSSFHIYISGEIQEELMARGRRRGPPPSGENLKKRKEENKIRNRVYRAQRTREFNLYKAFCEEPEIADLFKAFKEKKEQEFKEELKELEKVLMEDVTPDSSDKDLDAFVQSLLNPKMLTGNSAGPHCDSPGVQGETSAAAGSSSGPTTQSSPHNEMF
ncbi:hypothetical protein SLE2022_396220 [Rubroshorea leprosula]